MFGFIKAYFEKRRELRRQQWISTAKVFLDKYYKPIPEAIPQKELPKETPPAVLHKETEPSAKPTVKVKETHPEVLHKEPEPSAKVKKEEKTVQHSPSRESSTSSESSKQPTIRYSISCEKPPPQKEDTGGFRYSISFNRDINQGMIDNHIGLDYLATQRSTISNFVSEQKEETFVSTLFRHMRNKGYAAPTIYKRANIDKRHYSKIISNTSTSPTKDVAIALAFALRLPFDETQEFIGKAGYTLTHSSERDVLIEYCLKGKIYNIHEVNFILSEFKQKVLGEK